jgi:hypothetical protein
MANFVVEEFLGIGIMTKKRNSKMQIANEGVIHVRQITNDAGHIFREVQEEDIGVDAHIEICRNKDEPSGILVGLQIKAGDSYVHPETPETFTYYPKVDDLKYWREYSLPLFLVIYRPSEERAYWADIKELLKEHKFEDMLSGIAPKKFIVDKSNILSKNFFDMLVQKFGDKKFVEWGYDLFLQSLLKVTSKEEEGYNIPIDLRKALFYIDIASAIRLLKYLDSKQDELVQILIQRQSLEEALATEYVTALIIELRALVFEKERTGFILISFEKKEDRDSVAEHLEVLIPFNHYIILKGERLFLHTSIMNYFLLVASDGWSQGNVNLDNRFFPKLQQRFGLQWLKSYEFDFYSSKAASIFFTPDYYLEYIFESVCDTEDSFLLFDYLRTIITRSREENSEEYLWMSIGNDRIKICTDWDPALYGYFHCIRAIRSGGEWRPYYDFLLNVEFGIATGNDREDFIAKARGAKSLRELPLMTESMLENIRSGMLWAAGNSP